MRTDLYKLLHVQPPLHSVHEENCHKATLRLYEGTGLVHVLWTQLL